MARFQSQAYLWNKAPFLRLFLTVSAGIILEQCLPLGPGILFFLFFLSFLLALLYFLLPAGSMYRLRAANGLCFHTLLLSFGALLVWQADIRNDSRWIGRQAQSSEGTVAVLSEPLSEKAGSYKGQANASFLLQNEKLLPVKGGLMIYFKKDASLRRLQPGSRLLFRKPLQDIRNSGNPGAFDYRRYLLFQGVTHQVFLSPQDFVLLPGRQQSLLQQLVLGSRQQVVSLLQRFIPGKKEQGLAEALLIGYKEDLDKDLVQAYAQTGVVHIIAISGLHLSLIYGLLMLLTRPLQRKKQWLPARCLLVVSGLWLFSLLAGAQPSVLRSAVMFSCLALGELAGRRAFVFNTLALSAFLLLCYHPFWLWDVGFQLSYAAVLSIVLFFRPVYQWFYFPNKGVDWLWQLHAITLSAQILTLPLTVFYFHQFPLLFLLTNLVAVPASSLIVLGEILLCLIPFFAPAARLLGLGLNKLIVFMNGHVERLNGVDGALWSGFSISVVQAVLLAGFIAALAAWLMESRKEGLWWSAVCLLSFLGLRTLSFVRASRQQELIVYNVPHYRAIDLIRGRDYVFAGDPAPLHDPSLNSFHLQPSRILHRLDNSHPVVFSSKSFLFSGKRVLILDSASRWARPAERLPVDLLILSKNPRLFLSEVFGALAVKQVVIDASVPGWKAALWKRDCLAQQIPCYDVAEKGAFVMRLQ